jgi:hypothetical protein
MPFWSRRRRDLADEPFYVGPVIATLQAQAYEAVSARRWDEAERVYREIMAQADAQGYQVARHLLGQLYEQVGREDDVLACTKPTPRSGAHSAFTITASPSSTVGASSHRRSVACCGMHSATLPEGQRQWYRDRLRTMK